MPHVKQRRREQRQHHQYFECRLEVLQCSVTIGVRVEAGAQKSTAGRVQDSEGDQADVAARLERVDPAQAVWAG